MKIEFNHINVNLNIEDKEELMAVEDTKHFEFKTELSVFNHEISGEDTCDIYLEHNEAIRLFNNLKIWLEK